MKKLPNIFMAMLLLIGLVGCSADASESSTSASENSTSASENSTSEESTQQQVNEEKNVIQQEDEEDLKEDVRLQDDMTRDELINGITQDIRNAGVNIQVSKEYPVEERDYTTTYHFTVPYVMEDPEWDSEEDYQFYVEIGNGKGEGIVTANASFYNYASKEVTEQMRIIGEVLLKYAGTEEMQKQYAEEFNEREDISIDLYEDEWKSLYTSVFDGGGINEVAIW